MLSDVYLFIRTKMRKSKSQNQKAKVADEILCLEGLGSEIMGTVMETITNE